MTEATKANRRGYLSRKIIIENEEGAQETRLLQIVFPINWSINEDSQKGGKVIIKMKDFEIIPFSTEIPFIEYIDYPLVIRKNRNAEGYIMACEVM